MTVRELVATFGLHTRDQDFRRADSRIEGLKKAAAGLAALWAGSRIVQGVRRMAQETAQLGDGLRALSARSGVAIEAIQEMRYVGEAAGLSIQQVDGAIFRLSRRMGAALRGNKALADAFRRAGVSIRDANGQARRAEDVMMDLADRMAAMATEGERAAVGMQLMGDTGIAMAAALSGGSAEVARLREEAREFGLIQQELAEEGSRLVMVQQRLRYAIQGIKNVIGGAFLPWMSESIEGWLAWLRANRELVKLRLEQTVKAITVSMQALARVTRSVWVVFEALVAPLGKVGRALAIVLGVAGALLLVLGAKTVLVVGVIALIGLLIDELVTALQGGQTLIGTLMQKLKELWGEFLAKDFSWSDHPVLAFLQAVAWAIDEVWSLWGDFMVDLRRSPDWLVWLIKRMGPVGFLIGTSIEAGRKKDERYIQEHSIPPPVMTESEAAVLSSQPRIDTTINQSIEVNFSSPHGLTQEEIEAGVSRGVADGNRQALRSLVPSVAGGG